MICNYETTYVSLAMPLFGSYDIKKKIQFFQICQIASSQSFPQLKISRMVVI